jgi:hypothetical protein
MAAAGAAAGAAAAVVTMGGGTAALPAWLSVLTTASGTVSVLADSARDTTLSADGSVTRAVGAV